MDSSVGFPHQRRRAKAVQSRTSSGLPPALSRMRAPQRHALAGYVELLRQLLERERVILQPPPHEYQAGERQGKITLPLAKFLRLAKCFLLGRLISLEPVLMRTTLANSTYKPAVHLMRTLVRGKRANSSGYSSAPLQVTADHAKPRYLVPPTRLYRPAPIEMPKRTYGANCVKKRMAPGHARRR
jgi:hypothetical protein